MALYGRKNSDGKLRKFKNKNHTFALVQQLPACSASSSAKKWKGGMSVVACGYDLMR